MQLHRRGFLAGGAALAGALGVAGCGLVGPDKPLTKGTPTPKGSLLAKDFFYAGGASYGGLNGAVTPSTTVFRTPHFGAQLKQFGTLSKLTSSQASDVGLKEDYEGYRVPDGYEVVVVELRSGTPSFPDDGSVGYAMVVDGERHKLQPPFGAFNEKDERYQESGATLVACVAQGRPVTLEVSDAGKTAKLDCRTGERVQDADTDAMATLNTPASGTFSQKSYDFKLAFTAQADDKAPLEAGSVQLHYDLKRAGLLAWLPEAGWAGAGKGYLQVQLDVSSPIVDGQDMSIPLADTFRLSSASGLLTKPLTTDALSVRKDIAGASGGTGHVTLNYPVAVPLAAAALTIDNKAPVVVRRNNKDVPVKETSRSAPFTTAITLG